MGLISSVYGNADKFNRDVGNGRSGTKRNNKKQKRSKGYWMNRALRAEAQIGKRPSQSFYESEQWRVLRYQALKNCGAACQLCGATKEKGAVLHVDHIKPRSKYPDLALTLDNLQVLCKDCNLGKGAWDESDWRTKTLSGS